MKYQPSFLLACLVPSSLWASVLTFSGEPTRVIEASGQKIPVHAEATLSLKDAGLSTKKLLLTGAGLRVKKVVLVSVNVYALKSYVVAPSLLRAEAPMDGIAKNEVKALQLTFLREIDAGKIRDSFKESLETNGVDMASPAIKKVFEKLTFDMPEKGTMTLVGYAKDPKREVLVVESPQGTFSVEGEGVATSFWRIWFGKSADGGLEDLRADLIPKPVVN